EIAADAERLANALETLYAPLSQSLGTSLPRHTTVLLPNQGITRYFGGYVSLFPRMATMQAMPMQGFWGTNDWINTLTVEEGRNLVQIAKMNHGSSRLISFLFGEAGQAAVLGWNLPMWWFNGDARAADTAMLRGGVGQYASSEMATRALLLSGQNFSYLKAMHGSFRDAVPNQAELGAFLVNHVDRTSGPESWEKVMQRVANRSWNPLSLSLAMKKVTGRSADANYNETMSQLEEHWTSQAQGMTFSQPKVLNLAPKISFTGYNRPVFEKDGGVLAQKTGMDTYAVEVVRLRPDGHEQKLFHYAPLVNTSNRTSVVNGKVVWDEYAPDVRWIRGYSEILIRDVATGRTRRLTHKTRFMNPVISPDGTRIAVVEFLPSRQSSLVILDSGPGAELRRLPSPENDMIYTPAWSEDGRRVVMVTASGKGRALTVADTEAGTFQDVIAHCDEELANPVFYRDYILYKSSRSGMVNIFAVNIASGYRYRVTSAKFGADFPSVSADGVKLLYSDYTARGYNVAELPLDPSTWTPVDAAAASTLATPRNYHDYSAEIPTTQYPVQPYHPGFHLFDVHSWGPTSGPPDWGFGLMSNDKMGLMDFNASLLYNSEEHRAGFQTGFSYNRFFPALDFNFSDRNRQLRYATYNQNFEERTVMGGFHIPLNFSRGYYRTFLSVGVNVENISLQGGSFVPVNYGLNFAHIRQAAVKDLAPPWSQRLNFNYSQTVRASNYTANRLSADGRFALPGFVRHHAIVLESGYTRSDGNYYFFRDIGFPRGYTPYTVTKLTKFSGNYSLPLLYPDWSLFRFLYIKRISGNAFYDYGRTPDRLYRSTGAELIFDFHILHFPGFRMGVRDSYRIDFHNKRIQPFVAFGW
ncbi:MAG TPA: hypothetical protein VLY24_22925, partial [Bryobacteraceae bacterium]|nr:hypothetical protein [Bryobacteraceae bacterium]